MVSRRIVFALALAVVLPVSQALAEGERVYPALEEPMHKPVFHNDKIDVYDVQLEPGQQTEFHRHTRDQLGIVLRSGMSFNQALGAAETAISSERGSISYIPHSATGGYTHRVRQGADAFRVIGIEFAKPSPPDARGPFVATPEQRELEFAQGKLTRVTIAAGASLMVDGSLIIALVPGSIIASDGEAWSFKEGGVKWIGSKPAETYTNNSSTPLSLLVLGVNY